MTGTYETMVLLNNREVKKGWDACKSQICGLFKKHKAEIVSAKRWDELPLAFPVKRQLRGTYLLLYYQAAGNSLPAIRRELEYNETVLTHLTLVCEEIPEEAREPEAEFDIESVRVEETGMEAPPLVKESVEEPEASTEGEAKSEEVSTKNAGEEPASGEPTVAEGEVAPAAPAKADDKDSDKGDKQS